MPIHQISEQITRKWWYIDEDSRDINTKHREICGHVHKCKYRCVRIQG